MEVDYSNLYVLVSLEGLPGQKTNFPDKGNWNTRKSLNGEKFQQGYEINSICDCSINIHNRLFALFEEGKVCLFLSNCKLLLMLDICL